MSNNFGGAREGSGRPKGSRKGITAGELREAFEKQCEMSFEEMLAETGRRLYQDYLQGKNQDLWVRFSNNVAKYICSAPVQTVLLENAPTDKSDLDIDKRIRELSGIRDTATIIEVNPNEPHPFR